MTFRHAGEPFRAMHDALVGVAIDWSLLDAGQVPGALLVRAQRTWAGRAQSEYRSIQVLTRFLSEALAAGDPIEVQAGAALAIADEVRHTALTVRVVERLGATPLLPEPLGEAESPAFLALPAAQRALGTAVAMLAVNETVSVALIEDLRARATHPVIRAVLDATLADEDQHGDFGWAYVAASLGRFDAEGRAYAAACAEEALAPLVGSAHEVLARLPVEQRSLARWPEPELAHWGLRSAEREAHVVLDAVEWRVMPRLRELGIAAV